MASDLTLLARLLTGTTQPKPHSPMNHQLMIEVFGSIPSGAPVLQELIRIIETEFLQLNQPLPEALSFAFFSQTIENYAAEIRDGGFELSELYRRPLAAVLQNGNMVKSAANYYKNLLSALEFVRRHADCTKATAVLLGEIAVELAGVIVFILKKHA